uniref:Uncharacterized protein n=1 Tax=Anguilla anguilla TaxID=7936 RepID=A0A0E9XYL8_ANGAN
MHVLELMGASSSLQL